MKLLGIDVGGSGIKGAIVETKTGELLTERHRIPTPSPSTPQNVARTISKLVDHFNYDGVVGCGFPTVMVRGKSLTYGNIHPDWQGTDVKKLFKKATGLDFVIMNDADIAGFAELKFGEAKEKKGMVIILTIGTGIGSGVFYNGRLVPNIEMGRLLGPDEKPFEFWAGDKARKDQKLEWDAWGKRFNYFLKHIKRTFTPDHYILGGGASNKYDLYKDQITVDVPISLAKFRNNAGIVGAAIAARKYIKSMK